jgi:PKHD-type hydroxylase
LLGFIVRHVDWQASCALDGDISGASFMILQIGGVLGEAELHGLRDALTTDAAGFEPGAKTAGWQARTVKHNEQAQGAAATRAVAAVEKALGSHAVFRAAARPKSLVGLLVSRYRPGMSYGTHVDDALMNGVRTDLSFTVFLSEPDSYDGGELIIEGNDGEQVIKLAAGGAVIYPSNTLHRVEEVTRGERLVVVGWVRSLVRRGDQREILFDLDQSIAALREAQAGRAILDRLLKTRANLLRLWAED